MKEKANFSPTAIIRSFLQFAVATQTRNGGTAVTKPTASTNRKATLASCSKILSTCCSQAGVGLNALFAAKQGMNVVALDISEVGLQLLRQQPGIPPICARLFAHPKVAGWVEIPGFGLTVGHQFPGNWEFLEKYEPRSEAVSRS